jgi:hypothetical protein
MFSEVLCIKQMKAQCFARLEAGKTASLALFSGHSIVPEGVKGVHLANLHSQIVPVITYAKDQRSWFKTMEDLM